MSDLKPLELALAELMSSLSEDCWAAGWMSGTEDAVWELVQGTRTEWGMGPSEPRMVDAIGAVADLANAWIVWDDDEPDGFKAVSLSDWRASVIDIKETNG